jgi:hypothetical protein
MAIRKYGGFELKQLQAILDAFNMTGGMVSTKNIYDYLCKVTPTADTNLFGLARAVFDVHYYARLINDD